RVPVRSQSPPGAVWVEREPQVTPIRRDDLTDLQRCDDETFVPKRLRIAIPRDSHHPRGRARAKTGEVYVERVGGMPAVDSDRLDLDPEHLPRPLVKQDDLG